MSYIKDVKKEKIICMADMQPLQVARIEDDSNLYDGAIVMRTASADTFEVINITKMKESACWTKTGVDIMVRPLKRGEVVEVVLCNE